MSVGRRFVVLEHDHPFLHWDLMLETDGTLRTWRLLAEPVGGDPVPAEPLVDHRIAYLDYEGPVSGDRGHVTRWDHGTYEGHDDGRFVLHGDRLEGTFAFETEGDVCYLRRSSRRA